MQWLIDIIMELVEDRLKTFRASIHATLGAFNRGDPVRNDFEVGDFIQDNVWRELDLSAIVPASAKAVHLRVTIKTTVVNVAFNLRTKGNVFVKNVVLMICSVANVRTSYDCIVHPDTHGKIEYKCLQNKFDVINVTVAGWWLR